MERIWGPFLGHYVATLVLPFGSAGREFLGEARVSTQRPGSYREAMPLFEAATPERTRSAEEAHVAALDLACLEIARRIRAARHGQGSVSVGQPRLLTT